MILIYNEINYYGERYIQGFAQNADGSPLSDDDLRALPEWLVTLRQVNGQFKVVVGLNTIIPYTPRIPWLAGHCILWQQTDSVNVYRLLS